MTGHDGAKTEGSYGVRAAELLATFVQILVIALPWYLRRAVYTSVLGYRIHKTARIGYALIGAKRLVMGEMARIGHLTIVRGLDIVDLKDGAIIGNLNWIGGTPSTSVNFSGQPVRVPSLVLGEHSAITNRHYLDCSESINVGAFSTIAGVHTQMLTHSIDIIENQQVASPIHIGKYCFVGSGCIVLKGVTIPDYCVVGAGSVLTKSMDQRHSLYGGAPAKFIKGLAQELGYFKRMQGRVL